MTTPTAPLSNALCALTENPQVPRSITAILPAMSPAFVHELAAHAKVGPAQQPSDVVPLPSSASTRSLVTENSNGPHPAVPTGCLTPAIAGGEWTVTAFGGALLATQLPWSRAASGASVCRPFRRSTVSPKMSEAASLSAPGCQA